MKKKEIFYIIIFIAVFFIIYIYHNKKNISKILEKNVSEKIVQKSEIPLSNETDTKKISKTKQDNQHILKPQKIRREKNLENEQAAESEEEIDYNQIPVERKIIKKSELQIPDWADFFTGTLNVEYLIDINVDGAVKDSKLIKSCGIYVIDKAVYEFTKKLEFEKNNIESQKILSITIKYE